MFITATKNVATVSRKITYNITCPQHPHDQNTSDALSVDNINCDSQVNRIREIAFATITRKRQLLSIVGSVEMRLVSV